MPGEGPHGPRYSIGARREAGAGRGQHHAECARSLSLRCTGRNQPSLPEAAKVMLGRLPGPRTQSVTELIPDCPMCERERDYADDVNRGKSEEAAAQVWLLRLPEVCRVTNRKPSRPLMCWSNSVAPNWEWKLLTAPVWRCVTRSTSTPKCKPHGLH